MAGWCVYVLTERVATAVASLPLFHPFFITGVVFLSERYKAELVGRSLSRCTHMAHTGENALSSFFLCAVLFCIEHVACTPWYLFPSSSSSSDSFLSLFASVRLLTGSGHIHKATGHHTEGRPCAKARVVDVATLSHREKKRDRMKSRSLLLSLLESTWFPPRISTCVKSSSFIPLRIILFSACGL